jgi:hypothetical protein
MAELTEGVCDLCGKEADAKFEVSSRVYDGGAGAARAA